MDAESAQPVVRSRRSRQPGLSYKFQRLRERIREAIASGELQGKLPGERALAKRFRVNSKTLSKALTDLAGEGVLQRSVGRGTYVAGQMPSELVETRWLILADSVSGTNPLVTELLKLNPESRCITAADPLRPSMLSQYAVVINCSEQIPESLQHDLMLRGIPLVETVRPRTPFSTHAVLMDRAQGAFALARDLLLTGHKSIAAVDVAGSTTVFDAVKLAASRYNPAATVRAVPVAELASAISQGVSAIVCDGAPAAARARLLVEESRPMLGFHEEISVAAVGTLTDPVPCTGYYLDPVAHAAAVSQAIPTLQPHRLCVLWLSGSFFDRGTCHAPMRLLPKEMAAAETALAL